MCTPKQKRFIQEYLVDLNATKAALRAGYSPNTASEIGYENLNKPQIAELIQKSFQKRAARTEITQDKIVRGLAQIAFSDIRRIVSWDNRGIPIAIPSSEIDDNTAMAIKGITFTESIYQGKTERRLKVDLWDKPRALEGLAKHNGMFTEKHEITGKDGQPLMPPTLLIEIEQSDGDSDSGAISIEADHTNGSQS